MTGSIVDIKSEYLFLKMLLKFEKTLKSSPKVSQEALSELQHYIDVCEIWLNPDLQNKVGFFDIPPQEVWAYVLDLCGKELDNLKLKQKIREVLSSLKETMQEIDGRGGLYEKA